MLYPRWPLGPRDCPPAGFARVLCLTLLNQKKPSPLRCDLCIYRVLTPLWRLAAVLDVGCAFSSLHSRIKSYAAACGGGNPVTRAYLW